MAINQAGLQQALTILYAELAASASGVPRQDSYVAQQMALAIAGNDSPDPGGTSNGQDGWSPTLAIAQDGERDVLQLTVWIGGSGNPPAVGYIGATGFVNDIADGINIRGAKGDPGDDGWTASINTATDGDRVVLQVRGYVGGTGNEPTTLGYIGATGYVADIANATNLRGLRGLPGNDGVATISSYEEYIAYLKWLPGIKTKNHYHAVAQNGAQVGDLDYVAFLNAADDTPYTQAGTAVQVRYTYDANGELSTKRLTYAPPGVARTITYTYLNGELDETTPSDVAP